MIYKRLLMALTTVFAALTLAACGGGDGKDPMASVRVVHASPDAPAVDVYVNGDLVLEDVTYQAATGYLDIAAGDVEVAIRVANDSGDPVLAGTVTLDEDGYATLIAGNVVSELELIAVGEDGSAVTSGQARVNVVHASPSAGNVDLYVTAPGAALTAATLPNVPFGADASLGEVPAGSYQIRATAAGGSSVVYDSGTIALTDGDNVTVVAVDSTKGLSPVSTIVLTGTATNPVVLDNSIEVRVVHAVPDVDNASDFVDVHVNGELALANFAYKATTVGVTGADTQGYLRLPAHVDVAITLPGQAITSAVVEGSFNLERGEAYTVIATGSVLDTTIGLNLLGLMDDREASADTNAGRVRIVHAAPFASGAGANVDLYIGPQGVTATTDTGVIPLDTDFGFEDDSGYLDVTNGNYTALITPATTTSVAISADFSVAAGTVASAIAVGGQGGEVLEVLLLDDSN